MADLRTLFSRVDLRRLFSPRYERPFDLVQQRADYRRIPQSVLMDLAEFCGAIDPMPEKDVDLYKLGRIAGRRDVWLRLQQHLCLTEAEVYALMMGKPFVKAEEWHRAGMV
jgi:hypothetical protein